MKHQRCLSRYSRVSYHVTLFACLLLVGASPSVDRSAKVMAQDDKPKTADAPVERLFSGPQPGEHIKAFKVLRIKDEKTLELEIKPEDDERTTLICFVHKLSNDDRILYGMGLVDFYARRHKNLTSHIVLLSDDRQKITKMLQGWERGKLFPKSSVSVSVDGAEGPGYYGLNRNVAMTVVIAKGNEVVSNLVFNAPNGYDLEAIMVAVAKALGKSEPTLSKIQQELKEERQRQAEKRLKASPVFKLAPNEQLGRIMFGMVNARGNRSLIAQRLSKQFIDWASDSEERKSELRKYCKAVLEGDFNLNQYSRSALQKLVEE